MASLLAFIPPVIHGIIDGFLGALFAFDILKIVRRGCYSQYWAVAFSYVHKCKLSYMCPWHDVKLRQHRVKLYRIGCVGSGLVLA